MVRPERGPADSLDGAWRISRWFDPPSALPDESVAADIALVAAIAATHVVDHELVPWRFHVASHLTAAAAAVVRMRL